MKIPFDIQAFLDVFRKYNLAVWPMQVVLVGLALAVVYFSIKPNTSSGKVISGILAFFWLWMGIVYHILFFADINPAAVIFGVLFIVQGLLFLFTGFRREGMNYQFRPDLHGIMGMTWIVFSLLVYPIIGYLLGHVYPDSPTFGLPCPTVIYTFGILLLSKGNVPWWLVIIPFLWSVIGTSAAVGLGMREDIGLSVAGLTSGILIVLRNRKGHNK